MSVRRRKPSSKKAAPDTPPAATATAALANLEALLAVRSAGWDRLAVRDIIRVVYGSTEAFSKAHMETLRRMVKSEAA